MSDKSTSLQITKPVSIWNKPLRIDFCQLFIAITKATAHGLTGNWIDLTGDANEILKAMGVKIDPGQLAWALIRNAITQAIYDLVLENSNELYHHRHKKPMDFCKTLDFSFEQKVLTIDKSFFAHPEGLTLLNDIKKLLGFFQR